MTSEELKRYEDALDVYQEFDDYDYNCVLEFSDWLYAKINQ